MGNYSMADIANLTGSTALTQAEKSTSRKGNTELDMQDFLQLMVVQLQNQTIDDTMDTSEMINQMVQMQMITAITNMTETNIMSYASSLVGKVVTIGILEGDSLEEREVLVTGTGVSNGQQVIFGKDSSGKVETYSLNQIMAVGQLPPLEETEKPGEGGGDSSDKVEGDGTNTDKVEGDKTDGGDVTDKTEGTTTGGTQPPTATESPVNPAQTAVYQGEQGAPTD